MKSTKIFIIPFAIATTMINASGFSSTFISNLQDEMWRAPLKSITQNPLIARTIHFDVNARIGINTKESPKITLLNDEIITTLAIDLAATNKKLSQECTDLAAQVQQEMGSPFAVLMGEMVDPNEINRMAQATITQHKIERIVGQAVKTYAVEQVVAGLFWATHKAQEKTGITLPEKLKPVLENEYVAWLGHIAIKTVARAAISSMIDVILTNSLPTLPNDDETSTASIQTATVNNLLFPADDEITITDVAGIDTEGNPIALDLD